MDIEAPDWLQKYTSLFAGYGAILTLVVGCHEIFGPLNPFLAFLLLTAPMAVWTYVWIRFRNPPPNNKTTKFGICLLISTEGDPRIRARLENDIVHRLNELVLAQGLNNQIEIVVGTEPQAKKYGSFLASYRHIINSYKRNESTERIPPDIYKPFDTFQKQTRCHFFIWGSLNERQDAALGGEVVYTLKTDATIVHSDLLPPQQKILSEHFVRWLKEIRIDKRIENPGLQFGADEVYIMTAMVIGTAASLVGNVQAGHALHGPLLDLLLDNDPNPHHQAIRKELVKIFADECQFLGRATLFIDPDEARQLLNKAIELRPRHYNALLSLAVLEYIADNDSEKAMRTIERAAACSQGDGTWRYSKAFLQMSQGKHKASLQTYRDICNTSFENESFPLAQVMAFNHAEAEKGFVPSTFILALLTYKKFKNLPESLRLFETFLEDAGDPQGENKLLISKALEHRDQLLTDMS